MSDKIKKYVLPNIPYLLVLWFFLKLGTAYRVAAGAEFGEKLLGMIHMIGPALGTIAPGFDCFDWLIGVIGAIIIRLVVYVKVRDEKNYEKILNTARPGGAQKKTSSLL